MTTTITITRDHLDDVRPGDRLITLDDVDLGLTRIFTGTLGPVGPGGAEGIPYRIEGSKIEGYLYPRSHVERSIVVERAEPEPAPAPKRPRKPVTRTIDGVRLVRRGGAWYTEDGRYEVRLNYGGITECDGPHPVRVTWEMRQWAQENRTHVSAQPILTAIALGKRGYYCYGGEEHQAPDAWVVWDTHRNDYAGRDGMHCESFRDAAQTLARHLRGKQD